MFGLGKSVIFFLKALLFGIGAIVLIPKEQYKKYLIYGMFFGGFLDIIIILLFGEGLHLLKYYHEGPFSIFGIFPFWTPIAWTFTMMIFLYYLPVRKLIYYFYIVFFAIYGIFVGLVLEGFGLYSFNKPILFLAFLAWFWFSAYSYNYLERRKLVSDIRKS